MDALIMEDDNVYGRKLNQLNRVKRVRAVSGSQFVKRTLAQSEAERQDGRPARTRRLWPFYQQEEK